MDLKLLLIFFYLLIWNLDQKTFIFVSGRSIQVSPRDLPDGKTPPPFAHRFENKLLDLLGAKLLDGHLDQSSNSYPNVDNVSNKVSLGDVNPVLSDNTTDIRHKIKVVQNAKAYLIALKEKLERQKLAGSRNKEQTESLTVTETNFNTGKVTDLSRIDFDYEIHQMAATTLPKSSTKYTFEEPSEIGKTSEILINSSFYDHMKMSTRFLLDEGNLTSDINTEEFRLIGTAGPSLNTFSNINEFSNEYTKLMNNAQTEIPVVEKRARIITESTKDSPTTVEIQLIEPEVISFGNSRTSDRFTVTNIPKVISSTEKILIRPHPTNVFSNVISSQNTSTDQYSTTFSSIGQTSDFSSVDKSKYSEIKILGVGTIDFLVLLEQRKKYVKYNTFDENGNNFIFNSIVANVLEKLFSHVLRNKGGLLEEIRSIDKKFLVEEMENLPLEYLEVYEDILDLFSLNVLLVIHKQIKNSEPFYHNRGNSSMP